MLSEAGIYVDPRDVYAVLRKAGSLLTCKCKILLLLLDGKPHSTTEIMRVAGTIRVAARIHELRKAGYKIVSWADEDDPRIWYYQLTERPIPDPIIDEICGFGVREG